MAAPKFETQTGTYRKSQLTEVETSMRTSAKVGKKTLNCNPWVARGSVWADLKVKNSRKSNNKGLPCFWEFYLQ